MKIETEKLMRVKTAKKELNVSAMYVYELIEKELVNHVKIDGSFFIIRDKKLSDLQKKREERKKRLQKKQ